MIPFAGAASLFPTAVEQRMEMVQLAADDWVGGVSDVGSVGSVVLGCVAVGFDVSGGADVSGCLVSDTLFGSGLAAAVSADTGFSAFVITFSVTFSAVSAGKFSLSGVSAAGVTMGVSCFSDRDGVSDVGSVTAFCPHAHSSRSKTRHTENSDFFIKKDLHLGEV